MVPNGIITSVVLFTIFALLIGGGAYGSRRTRQRRKQQAAQTYVEMRRGAAYVKQIMSNNLPPLQFTLLPPNYIALLQARAAEPTTEQKAEPTNEQRAEGTSARAGDIKYRPLTDNGKALARLAFDAGWPDYKLADAFGGTASKRKDELRTERELWEAEQKADPTIEVGEMESVPV